MKEHRRIVEGSAPLRPLSKQEIDRHIEWVLADLSATIDAAVKNDGAAERDPLRPRWIRPGDLASRMRRFVADN